MAFQTSRDVMVASATNYQDLLDKLVAFAGANGWTAVRNLFERGVTAVISIDNGGSGYAVSNVVTLTHPNEVVAATLTVLSVAVGGEVTALAVTTPGRYTAAADLPGPTPTTGGTGTGLVLSPHFAGAANEKEIILQSTVGSLDVFVGVRTFRNNGTNAFQWEVRGFTGHNPTGQWDTQPDPSPSSFTFIEGGSTGDSGSFIPLTNGTIDYWWNITERRMNGCFNIGGTYLPWYLGLVSPFVTSGEWPLPLFVGGCMNRSDLRFDQLLHGIAGPPDPIRRNNASGPCLIRWVDGWLSVWNGLATASDKSTANTRFVTPTAQGIISPTAEDNWVTNSSSTNVIPVTFVPSSGAITAQAVKFWAPTPNSGGDLYIPVQCNIVFGGDPTAQIVASIDQLFWIFGLGLTPEDTLTIGSDTFHVFPIGNKTEFHQFWALREDS